MTEPSGRLTVTLSALPPAEVLEPLWRELEQRSDASFFQTWHWIGTWLGCLHPGMAAELLRVERPGAVVGLGIVIRRTVRRHGWLRARRLFLNTTGDPHLDEITIEYNGLLCARGEETDTTEAAMGHLLAAHPDWDEFYLDGLHRSELVESLRLCGARLHCTGRRRCFFVSLAGLRTQDRGYLEAIGSKTRHNIRRSIREYEKLGALRLDEAGSVTQARSYLVRLRHFHQRYWEAKGMAGSFANDFFRSFHDRLVERAFADGAIQVLRLTAGDTEVGYLYNFVHRGRVYNYQSGFDYEVNTTQNRPGLVSHTYAVGHNLERGHAMYEFMAGDSEYKESLGMDSRLMVWGVVRRERWWVRLEEALRVLLRRGGAPATRLEKPGREGEGAAS